MIKNHVANLNKYITGQKVICDLSLFSQMALYSLFANIRNNIQTTPHVNFYKEIACSCKEINRVARRYRIKSDHMGVRYL